MNNDRRKEYARLWREKNRERIREYNKKYQPEWRKKNIQKCRARALAFYYKNRDREKAAVGWRNVKTRYGLSQDDFNAILALQGGGCGLCGVKTQRNGKRLSVDHCHNSTVIRGILCEECNVLLGRMEKKPGWAQRVMEYLANPPAARVIDSKCAKPHVNGFDRMPGTSWRNPAS